MASRWLLVIGWLTACAFVVALDGDLR
jgi:hypothetical protein